MTTASKEPCEESFLATLRATLTAWDDKLPPRLTVAFSGGLDSTVLLAALARLGCPVPLRAVHVDHGIHADSGRWSEHCGAVAAQLGVDFASIRVDVDRASGLGLEAAARDVRYRALGQLLVPGEWLLTAHHADDQLETLLLRLLRGTGVRGMRGIIAFGPFGRGHLGRPLLGFTRADIADRAGAWGLAWLEDPANRELRHDRSYLRSRVIPALVARWPGAAAQAQRLAEQMAEAEELLDTVAAEDARGLARAWWVPRARLEALPAARQRNLLRYLLRSLALPTPSAAKLEELRGVLLAARGEAQPLVRWPGGEARVFRRALFLAAPLSQPSAASTTATLRVGESWSGPEGTVALVPAGDAVGVPESWVAAGLTLRFRGGGERLKPRGRQHHYSLKHLFQERGIVPWMRSRVPLLFRGSDLVAVGDEWLSADVDEAPAAEPRWRVDWREHPPATAPD
jgi:tRNA(Ile)-lysidine synthase